jgi:hypothetical protein
VANWKINCMENDYPGLWHSWFREQIVPVGWPPPKYGLHAPHAPHDWSLPRRYLQISEGDKVIVQLKNWRVGRIGTVLGKQIEDIEWDPSVPKQGGDSGEMGRRVLVRWEISIRIADTIRCASPAKAAAATRSPFIPKPHSG